MFLMVEKATTGGICNAIYWYAKAKNKYMKNYDNNKESSYLNYWNVNNLYGWAMSQKLPRNNFEWIEETFQFREKLVANLHNKNEYIIHIRNLKEVLNHGLILINVYRAIKLNQKTWLKPHIVMNVELRQKVKNNFEKDFFKLMENAVFGKTMENIRKHEEIKLVTPERRKNYLEAEPNYHTTKIFTESLLTIEMKNL